MHQPLIAPMTGFGQFPHMEQLANAVAIIRSPLIKQVCNALPGRDAIRPHELPHRRIRRAKIVARGECPARPG